MGLFTQPPAPPQDYLELDLFLRGDKEAPIKRYRRALASEWFPQSFVQLTWPHAGTDWAPMLPDVTECYVRLAFEIATREPLLVVAPDVEAVSSLLARRLPSRATDNIFYLACPTNDTWARDHAFLSVIGTAGVELLDFRFNGWGGKFPAALDNAVNRRLYDSGLLRGTYTDHLDFELEGGSIESDGMGTLLTTEACLLNPNRGHVTDRAQVELMLREWFSAERVLWLRHGHLAGDDTDGHIDTLARLCPDGRIAYVRCDDHADEHYDELRLMHEELLTFRQADGSPFELVPLPLPDPVFHDGERLPATYANYLVVNGAVLYPTYAQPQKDDAARAALARIFKKHDLVGVDCRPLIRQHGSLHCATMQYPKGALARREA